MCQAKPGPRCSSDTANEWITTNASLQKINTALEEAELNQNQALLYHNHHNTPESKKLLDGWTERVQRLENSQENAKNRTRDAEYSFYATPKGIERLQNKSDNIGSKVVLKKVGFFTEDGDWAEVRYPEYANNDLTLMLQQAKAHRNRQQEAFAYTVKPNIVIPTGSKPLTKTQEKYFAARNLINQVEAEKSAVEHSLRVTRADEEKALQSCYETRSSIESIQSLIAATRSIRLAEIKLAYLNLHLKDLHHVLDQHTPKTKTTV